MCVCVCVCVCVCACVRAYVPACSLHFLLRSFLVNKYQIFSLPLCGIRTCTTVFAEIPPATSPPCLRFVIAGVVFVVVVVEDLSVFFNADSEALKQRRLPAFREEIKTHKTCR